MAASYPASAKTFTTKSNTTTADSSHINDVQLEITAIEQDLIAGLPVTRGGTGNTTITANRVLLGNGTSAIAVASAGTAGQVLTSNGASAPTFQDATQTYARDVVHGRLTLTSATAVTTSDVTAATTLYFALHRGNQIGLYTGAAWQLMTVAELSIAVPSTTDTNYDVFVDYNAGTPALSLTAWTNGTTRATALTTQDGVLVLTGSTGKRYVGTFRTTGVSGQTEDSFAKRFVWNYYNRVPRPMRVLEATNTWTYNNGTTFRQANNSAANQLAFVVGVAEVPLRARVYAQGIDSTGIVQSNVAIGINSATTPTTGNVYGTFANATDVTPITAELYTFPAVGYSFAAWLEQSASANTFTWYGDNNAPTLYQSGIHGEILG